MSLDNKNVLNFKNISNEEAYLVGKYASKLGEIFNSGFPIPSGFVITPNAFSYFLRDNKLDVKIKHVLSTANFNHLLSLAQISSILKKMINEANLPKELIKEILHNYKLLNEPLVNLNFIENSSDQFKKQIIQNQPYFSNIKGEAVLIEKIKNCWSHVFDTKELFYRHNLGKSLLYLDVSLIIQEAIYADKSGFILTSNLKSNDKSKLIIKAVLGELDTLLNDESLADIYEVKKEDKSIIKQYVADQNSKIVTKNSVKISLELSNNESKKQKLSNDEILKLTEIGINLENSLYFPQKVSWAIKDKSLYLTDFQQNIDEAETKLNKFINQDILLSGIGINKGIVTGTVKVISSSKDFEKVRQEDIVVIKEVKSSYLPFFKKSAALLIEGYDKNMQIIFTSHNLKIPCVVGVKNATTILINDEIITVNATKGEVYKGGLAIKNTTYFDIHNKKTATKLYLNLNGFDEIDLDIIKKADGFLVTNSNNIIKKVGIHPKKLLLDKMGNTLSENIYNYLKKLIEKSDHKQIMYKFSSLTSKEYRFLNGGDNYERLEENPLLGFRGAQRHIVDKSSFYLELEAIKKLSLEYPLHKIIIILPFLRTTQELIDIKSMISSLGLMRSNNFKIFISLDIPTNMFMIESFSRIGVDGFIVDYLELATLLTGFDTENPEFKINLDSQEKYLKTTFEKLLHDCNKYSIPCIYSFNLLSVPLDLIKSFVNSGVFGISVEANHFNQTRNSLLTIEKNYINK